MAGLNQLVDKIRTAHPGSYDDMDDATLTKRVLNKYPQYSDLAAPSPAASVARPAPMETSALGHLASQSVPRANVANTQEGMPGFEGSYASGDEGKAAAMTTAGVGAALPVLGAKAMPVIGGIAAKHPLLTSMVLSEAISQARHVPYVGRFVPPYSELLPFLLSGGEGKPKVPGEVPKPAKPTAADVYRPDYRAPRAYYGGQPPEPIPPRSGLLLEGEVAAPPPKPEAFTFPKIDPYRAGYRAPRAYYGGVKPEPIPQRQGLMLPSGQPEPATLPTIEKPAPKPAAPVKPIQMQDAIERGLGNEPVKIQPGVKLKDQMTPGNGLPKISDMAPGHTPIESSSALRSYKYDPAKREFEVHPQGGNTVYVYGDVSPEAASAFEQAGSKGQAWQQLRSNPLVAKIQGGQRIAMRGAAPEVPAPPAKPVAPSKPIAPEPPKAAKDLTGILRESVRQARKKKGLAAKD